MSDIPDWPGWEKFLKYYENAEDAPYPEDSKLYFTAIFETGCREAEVICLTPSMFRWNDEALVINGVPVLKKRKRVTRDIVVKLDDLDPLGFELIDFVESCDTDYLLPGLRRFSREKEKHRHVSPKTVYNRISEIHKDLWPQAIRAYRASMLVFERGFTVQDLVRWFEWKSADMALHYTRTKDIANSMGIKNLPK